MTSLYERELEFRRITILTELEQHRWNMTATAKSLGLCRTHLQRLVRDLGLARPSLAPKR